MKRAAPALLSALALTLTVAPAPLAAEGDNAFMSTQGATRAAPARTASRISTQSRNFGMPATSGQHWVNAQGCEYSRAGLPGAPVWYIIVNTRRPGCPTYIGNH